MEKDEMLAFDSIPGPLDKLGHWSVYEVRNSTTTSHGYSTPFLHRRSSANIMRPIEHDPDAS